MQKNSKKYIYLHPQPHPPKRLESAPFFQRQNKTAIINAQQHPLPELVKKSKMEDPLPQQLRISKIIRIQRQVLSPQEP